MHTYKKLTVLLCCALLGTAMAAAQDRDTVAGIPVNYDESKVGDYKDGLPDPLTFNNGKHVTRASQWKKRRAEIFKLFEENQFGRWQAKKPKLRYDVKEDAGFGGEAVRKQISLYFSPDNDGPYVDVLLYLPKDAVGAVPILLNLSFSPNNFVVSDPGVKPGRRWDPKTRTMSETASMPGPNPFGMDETIRKYLAEGFGFATLCYTDITPDFNDDDELGLRGLYHEKGAPRASDDWGSISAWAFGVSCLMDYFEKDPDVDATRVALTGCSRLGKTTIWTGACEPRIKVVMPSCSGEGGAAMSRRNFGETVAHLAEQTRFPYQFCPRYAYWGDKVHQMPVDAHMLVALIAPRPLLLQTGTTDNWSDPKGEWISLLEARKVYQLLGQDVPAGDEMPAADQPVYTTLGYVMHEGGHGVMPQDWTYYLEFMKRHL
ncbi:MAG: acetylxylan esterase [Bacteroidales bacterium]|nr:acetylxylan esterase [Bacteroidales bacterium]